MNAVALVLVVLALCLLVPQIVLQALVLISKSKRCPTWVVSREGRVGIRIASGIFWILYTTR